jgi:hypothetical protein
MAKKAAGTRVAAKAKKRTPKIEKKRTIAVTLKASSWYENAAQSIGIAARQRVGA